MNWPRAGRAPLTPRRRCLPALGTGHPGEKTVFGRSALESWSWLGNRRELRSRAGPRARGEPAILRIAWAIRARKIISDHAGRLPRRKTHLLDKNPRTPPRPPLQFPGRKIFSTPKKPKTIQRSKFLTNFVAVISEKPETEDYNREQLRTLFATTTIVPLHGLRPGSFPTGGDDMTEEHPLAVFCSPGLTRLLRPLPTTTDRHTLFSRPDK